MDPAPAEKNDKPPAIADEEEGEIKDSPKAEGTKRKVSDDCRKVMVSNCDLPHFTR